MFSSKIHIKGTPPQRQGNEHVNHHGCTGVIPSITFQLDLAQILTFAPLTFCTTTQQKLSESKDFTISLAVCSQWSDIVILL